MVISVWSDFLGPYPQGIASFLLKIMNSHGLFFFVGIWVNYNDLTATSLEIMVSKGNHPNMALFQVSELL